MLFKIIGVVFVIFGCGSMGFRLAACHRQEEKALRQLIGILDFMECELQYRLTPLPQLCRQAATEFRQLPGSVFSELASEMESQVSPDIGCCMSVAMEKHKALPPITKSCLEQLSRSIGQFDLEGQLKGLESVRQDCRRNLEELGNNREVRLRSYQTLGLCAGAALVILLI